MQDNSPLDQLHDQQNYTGPMRDLPDAGRILTMGILSIVLFIGIVGFVLAFVTLNKSKQALERYTTEPGAWTAASLSKVKTGRVCAMISLALFGAMVAFILSY